MPKPNELSDEEHLKIGQAVYDRLPELRPGTVGQELDKAYGLDED